LQRSRRRFFAGGIAEAQETTEREVNEAKLCIEHFGRGAVEMRERALRSGKGRAERIVPD